MVAAVAIRDLHKAFGELRALDGIDFEIGQGELFGLLGPNGAGKSTLLNTAIGETLRADGDGFVTQSVSVAPQEPWIYEGTIKATTADKTA